MQTVFVCYCNIIYILVDIIKGQGKIGIKKPLKVRVFPRLEILAIYIISNKNALGLHNTTTIILCLQ